MKSVIEEICEPLVKASVNMSNSIIDDLIKCQSLTLSKESEDFIKGFCAVLVSIKAIDVLFGKKK